MSTPGKESPVGKPASGDHPRSGSGEGSNSAFTAMIKKRQMAENRPPEPQTQKKTQDRGRTES